jgi:glycosyltransferase involved in cell wall biosynthesis
MNMQNIGIDCRLAGIRHAGIGRYTENLVKRLPLLSSEYLWIFFFTDKDQAEQVLGKSISLPNVKVVFAPAKHYSLSEQLQLPKLFKQESLSLLHVPHFNVPLLYGGKLIITIHDLLWHEYRGLSFTTLPSWLYHLKYVGYQLVVGQAVAKATTILVPAQTIKRTLLRYYPSAEKKIVVTKEGVDDKLQNPVGVQNKATDKNLLYIGSLYPHKNLKVVIDALPKLPDYQLLVVGTRNVFQERVAEYVKQKKLEHQVKFLGYVSDEDLQTLFTKTRALVQPSLSEGFGLTGVEAMAMHVPLLASDIPIFKEIYQDGALYFDPHLPDSFVEAVKTLEDLSSVEHTKFVKTAAKVGEQYSWDSMAKETLEAYKHILQ